MVNADGSWSGSLNNGTRLEVKADGSIEYLYGSTVSQAPATPTLPPMGQGKAKTPVVPATLSMK